MKTTNWQLQKSYERKKTENKNWLVFHKKINFRILKKKYMPLMLFEFC